MANVHLSPITCHVLDSTLGKPASGIQVRVAQLKTINGSGPLDLESLEIGFGQTDVDGRCKSLLAPGVLTAGLYKVTFYTSTYFTRMNVESFYPLVEITFQVKNPEEHYHIPLLLSPYSFTTYRGS